MNVNTNSVLIISPESWGKSKVSKHHYALAFAEKGFNVYFLNITSKGESKVNEVCVENDNITLTYINLSPLLNSFRFHFRLLYNFLLRFKIKQWLKIHPKLDYLVSFDCNGVFTNLAYFNARHTVFFPVDQVNERYRKAYKGFDKLMSISPVILRAFPDEKDIKLLHHGLSPYFANKNYAYNKTEEAKNIAYVGNLLIGPILDKGVMKEIINNNTDLQFHFYGAYDVKNSNLGANLSAETLDFIEFLKISENCVLHGMVSPEELADAYNNMDAFLVCYDYKYDKNECSNSHKIMEYLSTGKPVISTRVSMYDDMNLFSMMKIFDNSDFPTFFKEQINQWTSISTRENFERRKTFANSNAYSKKVLKIITLEEN